MPENKDWWVYVLQSQINGHTYVGSAVDPLRRLRQHNGLIVGGGKHTAANRPWEIKAIFGPYLNRSEAFKAEIKLKHSKRGANRINWSPADSDKCKGLGKNDPRCLTTPEVAPDAQETITPGSDSDDEM